MEHCVAPWSGSGRTDMSKVAIVAALEREVRPLVKDWRADEKEHEGRHFRFFVNGEFVLVCGGIGAEAARRAAEAVIAIYEPAIVYSAGFAGALDPSLKVGEILRPERVVNASDGSSVRYWTAEMACWSRSGPWPAPRRKRICGNLLERKLSTWKQRQWRGPQMRAELPFEAVKAISDESDFDFPRRNDSSTPEGKFSEWRFALFVALRPWMWPSVFALARNSKRASRALCTALRK